MIIVNKSSTNYLKYQLIWLITSLIISITLPIPFQIYDLSSFSSNIFLINKLIVIEVKKKDLAHFCNFTFNYFDKNW